MKVKLIKNKCEIESCTIDDENALHFHHIIERTMVNTNNHPFNLALHLFLKTEWFQRFGLEELVQCE